MDTVTPDIPGHKDPGPGRRLGLDVGTVRIGVAVSDRDARMAMPVETVARDNTRDGSDGTDIERLLELVDFYQVVEVVVGLPRNLNGSGSVSAQHAQDMADRIQRRLSERPQPQPVVRMADERLSTVVAHTALRRAGVREKAGRKVIDQVAAVEILQSWLDGRNARDIAEDSNRSG